MQVVIVELAQGKVQRLQAYQPYGPKGTQGWILKLVRFFRRLFEKQAKPVDSVLAIQK
jgi:hypothetical protein